MSQPEITPVRDDITATAPQLLARARADYAQAQQRREQREIQQRIRGNQTGGTQ